MRWRTPTRCLAGGLAVVLGAAGPATAQTPAPAGTVAPARGTAAAVVNGDTITLDEVEALLKQRPPAATPLTAQQQRQLRTEALSALVDDVLIKQFLRDKGPKVEPAEVEEQVAALAKAMQAQSKTLADFCRETQQTEAQLRAGMKAMLQMDRHVKQYSTDEDLKKYYEANKDFFDRVKVRASHIVLRLSATASPGEREQARQKLLALKAEIAAGKLDFAAAAKANSHCPSAEAGGDVGEFTRKFMLDEAFAKAAFAMKVGEVSDLVETEFGIHLIKLTERTPGTGSTFSAAMEEVRDCHREEFRQALLAQLRKAAQVQVMLP